MVIFTILLNTHPILIYRNFERQYNSVQILTEISNDILYLLFLFN